MEPTWSYDAIYFNNSSPLVNDTNEFVSSGQLALNETDPDAPVYYPIYMRIWVTLVSGIIFILGVAGNALVPLLIWKNKELRNSTNVFLLNLALADILVLLICLPTALIELHTIFNSWMMGPFLCRLVPFVEISVTRASILTLTVISMERYVAISRPLSSSSTCTRQRALGLCLSIWPVSFLAAGPFWAATDYKENQGPHNISQCAIDLKYSHIKTYFLLSCVFFYLLPLCFLATLYFCIARKLLDKKSWAGGRIDKAEWKKRKQVAFMLGIVVAVFFICLLPFQAFTIWIIYADDEAYNSIDEHAFSNIIFFCRIMIYINSTINPIIYNTMSAKFRKAFMNLFANIHKPGRRLVRRRSTMMTSLSSSSSHSRTISLRRRASLAITRRFSSASSRRSSEKSLMSRRSSGLSSSSRKTSSSSSRKGSHCTGHHQHNGEPSSGHTSPDSQKWEFDFSPNNPTFPHNKGKLVTPLRQTSNGGAGSDMFESSPDIDGKLDSWFVEKTLLSSPPTSPNSAKKVSFNVQKELHCCEGLIDPQAPVAPPRRKRSRSLKKTAAGQRVTESDDQKIERDDVTKIRKENERHYRFDRFQRDCKCNSRTITRCSFRKSTKIEIECSRHDPEDDSSNNSYDGGEEKETNLTDMSCVYIMERI